MRNKMHCKIAGWFAASRLLPVLAVLFLVSAWTVAALRPPAAGGTNPGTKRRLLISGTKTVPPVRPEAVRRAEQAENAETARLRGLTEEQVQALRTQRGLTHEDLRKMPQGSLERALRKLSAMPSPDHPDEAMRWRLETLQDENGEIPEDAWSRAREHIRQMEPPASSGVWGVDGHLKDGGLTTGGWTSIGPGNIGGRLRSCVIHPANPAVMFAGSIAGGIWKTTNGGTSWSQVNDFMTNLAVTTMIMSPVNSNILYAGTGEGYFNYDAIRGNGVFKSTDGGSTWQQLASTNNSSWYYVNRLAITADGAAVLAATNTGLYVTFDGGDTWQQYFDNPTQDVKIAPGTNDLAIAAGRGFAAYYDDSTINWYTATGLQEPAGESPRVELAYASSNPLIVYASQDVNSGTLYRSTDGGRTYAQVNTGTNYLGAQGWYDNVVWVDPTNPDTLVVGGIDLWRSTNGGSILTKISEWYNSPISAHADHHFIVHHPQFNGTSNTTVYFCNDGGIYRASNVYTVLGTSGWLELNNTLSVTQFYGGAGHPVSGVIIGGTQDVGTLRYAGNSENWSFTYGGDGGQCAFDMNDSNYCYGEYVNLRIFRSTNGGLSADYICGQYWNGSAWAWKSAPYVIPDARDSKADFIAPFVLDPNNSNRILGGGYSLWRTNDAKTPNTPFGGPSWEEIKTALGSTSTTRITAVTIFKNNSDIVMVGHNNGKVFRSINATNATPAWSDVSTGLPVRRCTELCVDPGNSNVVYAAFSGFQANNLYKSTDGGTSWADATGSGTTGLPDAPVRAVTLHPNNSNWVYVGTEVGIFASEDGGATWSTSNAGPANCSVDDLFWMNNVLVAATHGRGMFRITINTSTPAAPAAPSNLQATAASATQVNLTWNDNSNNEDSFKIERKTGAGGSFAEITSVGANVTSYSNTGLTSGQTYYYRVRAYNAGGYSSYSPEANATPGGTTAPATPSNLQAVAASSSQINLTWNDNSNNETNFRIERKTGTGGSFTEITTVNANTTSYSNTGLTASTTYYYRIRAYNAAGYSSYSPEANATTQATATIPNAPTNLVALRTGASQITINWQDNSGNETGFRIERKAGTSGSWAEITVTAANVTSLANNGLSAGNTFFYRVRATNTAGNSAYSNTAGSSPGNYDLIIPAMAHTGSWVSDLDLANTSGTAASVQLALLRFGTDNTSPTTSTVAVPAGRTVRMTDLLASTFSASNAALGIRFLGGTVRANCRFYNVGTGNGTYGMGILAVTESQAIPGDDASMGLFHHMGYQATGSGGFRTNIGFASASAFNVVVRIKLYGDNGELLGTLNQTLRPYEHFQITKIHQVAGITVNITHGHATVEVLTAGGKVHAYAMTIDNKSQDPVYWPVVIVPR